MGVKASLFYREAAYSITKGPSTVTGEGLFWHGVILFSDQTRQVVNVKTKAELVRRIERSINVLLDYDGDDDLCFAVEKLVLDMTGRVLFRAATGEPMPTAAQLRRRIGRICELAQKIIDTRYAKPELMVLTEKLRAMTVANGCASAEEAAAKEKLRKLLEPAGG